ncbi:O-antigen ligase family protein [Rivularia sp. UHCC 0363]|uniref:O-antigen ligase family protein n=1 Tax=Rivularia sp. UHCC 0363 TaxID=3110244 RepID=UPI002B21907F|nr:O-antigen ligase family protein [Rivularia sp. UHCC 0363]MEA5596120.1 O-antigen ligase family protein [Rivularia sp. UHCC 0363]
MSSNFINKLADIIASPLGLVGIIIGLLIVYQAGRSRRLAWFLFTICCFAASLSKFQDQFTTEVPALVFPLQQIRDMGRPLTIIFLGLILMLGLKKQHGWRRMFLASPIKYLLLVQGIIFIKTLAYGSISFAFLAFLTFGAVVLMLCLGPSRWLQDEQNFRLGVWSLAMVGVIFIITNSYQAAINIYPITFVHGRLLGTTGNPQHAAVLLAATVPCFMFLIESQKQWSWAKVCWITGLVFIMLGLFLTGSRTGAIMGVVSILFFYRQRGGAMLRLGLFAAIVLAIILPFLSPDGSILGTDSTALAGRFASTANSRGQVWSAMWNGFMNNIFFGASLDGDRLGYGENSWLAAGASLGLVGFIPLVMFGVECIKMMLRLNKISARKPIYSLQCNTVIAGLISLLVGSIFEAFLLGNLTFSLMALLMYLSLGKYLVDIAFTQRTLIKKLQFEYYSNN